MLQNRFATQIERHEAESLIAECETADPDLAQHHSPIAIINPRVIMDSFLTFDI